MDKLLQSIQIHLKKLLIKKLLKVIYYFSSIT